MMIPSALRPMLRGVCVQRSTVCRSRRRELSLYTAGDDARGQLFFPTLKTVPVSLFAAAPYSTLRASYAQQVPSSI